MNTRSCAIVFAFTLFATAVCAEPLPPAADNRPDAGLEAFVAQVGVDLSQNAVLADLAAMPRIRLPDIQGCLGDFDPHDAGEAREGHALVPFG